MELSSRLAAPRAVLYSWYIPEAALPRRRLATQAQSVKPHAPAYLLKIRPLTPADADGASALLTELGYPTSATQLPVRLAALLAEPRATALVAEDDAAIVGLVTGHVFGSIHADEPVAYVTTLVVTRAAARRGIGRRLVEYLANWARERGALRLSVTTGAARHEAHAFYLAVGFQRTGERYTRDL